MIVLIITTACIVSAYPGQVGRLIPYAAMVTIVAAALKFRKRMS
jgi:hypothetical protein